MATNLNLDDKLVEEAKKVGKFKSKKDAVNEALKEFVQRHRQLRILDWEGKVDFFHGFDHKQLRKKM